MSGELKSVLEDGPIEGEPLVSVCVITYNHGKYIRQCLDGILMQKVNFPYEILIHDDASPDDTADIIREYWEKYPTVIKPILRTENQYSKGVDVCWFNFDRAKAKYIAQCEGDDYWTDDGKLQMQVDFLEEHGEYVACVHRVRVIDGEGNQTTRGGFDRKLRKSHYNLRDCERPSHNNFCDGHLCSLLHKNIYPSLNEDVQKEYYSIKLNGDTKLFYLLLCHGDISRSNKDMATHRCIVSGGTSWSARTSGQNHCEIGWFGLNQLYGISDKLTNTKISWNHWGIMYYISAMLRYIKVPTETNRNIYNHIKSTIPMSWLFSYSTVIAIHSIISNALYVHFSRLIR